MINHPLKIADLLFSYIKGDITENEKTILDHWVKASPQNKQLFDHLIAKESYISKSEIYTNFATQNRYGNIRKSIRTDKIRLLYKYASVAAAVLLPLLILYILLNWGGTIFENDRLAQQLEPGKSTAVLYTPDGTIIDLEKEEFEIKDKTGALIINKNNALVYKKDSLMASTKKERPVKVVVPRGGEYHLELSDGTKVWLNSESSIEHPLSFIGDKRVVKIRGEAYFEVSHDKNKPFIVLADQIGIEVLGTAFNIRAYEDEDMIATTLVEGKVRSQDRYGKGLTLKPSQQFTYNKKSGEYQTAEVDVELYTSWKDGLFVFHKQSLENILNTISRWYDVAIFYESDKSRHTLFSGRLGRYDNAGFLLEKFEEIEDVKFKIDENVIIVK